MKKSILLILSALFPFLLQAQSKPAEGDISVQQTVVNMFAKLADQDSVGIRNYCTSDVVLYENGQIWTLDSLIKKGITANIGTNFKRTNKFDFINTTIRENTAWVSYNLYSVMERGERKTSVHWMETVILIKEKKQWKIKVLHSTLIKRA
ncbi:hypothetical protein [Dyadobacter arcticus]|uniref:DUF4440 domain-containing protein n=1 Tax=Dyadobacter arcticus TaxID=1078754 RepID=A0ABX0UML6_9BACT|nr:hypothetical protein [Dyadobacter arcticus]NIJ54206.1 hypothetical protein [Dyadobacter arcticus]